jgi:hypothetical protein
MRSQTQNRFASTDVGFLVISTSVFIAALLAATTAGAAPCVLGNANNLSREFSVPRNGVCVIRRSEGGLGGRIYVSQRISVAPKLGQFGKAFLLEMAYRAGPKAGDDYFEYISTEIDNGTRHDWRIRNVVHITP